MANNTSQQQYCWCSNSVALKYHWWESTRHGCQHRYNPGVMLAQHYFIFIGLTSIYHRVELTRCICYTWFIREIFSKQLALIIDHMFQCFACSLIFRLLGVIMVDCILRQILLLFCWQCLILFWHYQNHEYLRLRCFKYLLGKTKQYFDILP